MYGLLQFKDRTVELRETSRQFRYSLYGCVMGLLKWQAGEGTIEKKPPSPPYLILRWGVEAQPLSMPGEKLRETFKMQMCRNSLNLRTMLKNGGTPHRDFYYEQEAGCRERERR